MVYQGQEGPEINRHISVPSSECLKPSGMEATRAQPVAPTPGPRALDCGPQRLARPPFPHAGWLPNSGS